MGVVERKERPRCRLKDKLPQQGTVSKFVRLLNLYVSWVKVDVNQTGFYLVYGTGAVTVTADTVTVGNNSGHHAQRRRRAFSIERRWHAVDMFNSPSLAGRVVVPFPPAHAAEIEIHLTVDVIQPTDGPLVTEFLCFPQIHVVAVILLVPIAAGVLK